MGALMSIVEREDNKESIRRDIVHSIYEYNELRTQNAVILENINILDNKIIDLQKELDENNEKLSELKLREKENSEIFECIKINYVSELDEIIKKFDAKYSAMTEEYLELLEPKNDAENETVYETVKEDNVINKEGYVNGLSDLYNSLNKNYKQVWEINKILNENSNNLEILYNDMSIIQIKISKIEEILNIFKNDRNNFIIGYNDNLEKLYNMYNIIVNSIEKLGSNDICNLNELKIDFCNKLKLGE